MKKLLLISLTLLVSWTAYSQCIVADTVITNTTCTSLCNGSINITITGGDGNYTYAWDNGAPDTNFIQNLCQGTYTVVAYDQAGCSVTESYLVTASSDIIIGYTTYNESCPGVCDGAVQMTVQGAVPPINIGWSEGSPGTDQGNYYYTDVCSNYYYGYLYDSRGCMGSIYFQITSPIPLMISATPTNKDCYGINGSVDVLVESGDTPIAYLWNTGASTQSITGLDLGRYDVTVTDTHGCSATDYAIVSSNGNLYGYIFQDSTIHCNGDNDAKLTASVMGGVMPFSYYWSNGFEELGVSNYSSNQTNLAPGLYMVTITDSNTNSGSCPTLVYAEVTQPDSVSINYNVFEPYCHGQASGSIDVIASGGTTIQGGYHYFWSHNVNEQWGYVSGLTGGNYTVTVTDDFACQAIKTIELMQPDSFMLDTAIVSNGCVGMNNGYIILNFIGGTPPYIFSPDSMGWFSNNDFYNLAPDVYTFEVKDTNNCTTPTVWITITAPTPVTLSVTSTPEECSTPATGAADATIAGGTPPYTFNWSNTETSEDIFNLTAGTYYLYAYDANECEINDSVTVSQLGLSTLSGTLLYNSAPVTASQAQIELYKEITGIFGLEYLNVLPVDAGGNFTFTDVPTGNFTLKAKPDTSVLSAFSTWYIDTINWEGATMINVGCEDTITGLTFELKQVPVLTGQGTFSGYIHYWDTGKGFLAVGEPVVGAEVFVEQEPNDEPIAQGSTGSDGYYYFGQLAENESYSLHVDVAGLPILSTYQNIPVTSTMNDYVNMNYFIDTTEAYGGIFTDTSLSVNFKGSNEPYLLVYPNPIITQANISFNLDKSASYFWSLYDETGKLIDQSEVKELSAGKHQMVIPVKEKGVYFLINSLDNNRFVKKIVKE